MDQMATLFEWSVNRCNNINLAGESQLQAEELERFDALTGRFVRFNDILLQKIFRLIDELDLDSAGTVRDRVNRAEKKGLIDSALEFIEIRELRNSIAHEYETKAIYELFKEVLKAAPVLLEIPKRIRKYCDQYV